MNKTMSIAAFVISLVAFVFAIQTYLNADRTATQALHRREQKMIDRLWPDMKVIYADLMEGSKGYTGARPDTIEELFAPVITVLGKLGE